jgi:hypothetical protein
MLETDVTYYKKVVTRALFLYRIGCTEFAHLTKSDGPEGG